MAKGDESEWATVPSRKSRKREHSDDDGSAGDEVVYVGTISPSSRPNKISHSFKPFVLVLVGIPGSGKVRIVDSCGMVWNGCIAGRVWVVFHMICDCYIR